ncbi:MAG: PLDc_N domain-containing protein [Caldilineaceae bacterium]|nr:PLDc_N domain-containing protein [Caldilineaceae bacterium]
MNSMPKNKKWSELSTATRVRIILFGLIQVSLMIAALVDIRKRPAEQIKGSKKMWTALAFVNWIGPIAYFVIGRKRGVAADIAVSE